MAYVAQVLSCPSPQEAGGHLTCRTWLSSVVPTLLSLMAAALPCEEVVVGLGEEHGSETRGPPGWQSFLRALELPGFLSLATPGPGRGMH